jgi:hypothetical protein
LIQVLFGSFLLSVIHALIPSHWLPIVAVSRAQKWSRPETLVVTAVTGLAHTSSTILLGMGVGLLGHRLSDNPALTAIVPPTVLVLLGLVYLSLDWLAGHGEHRHVDDGLLKSKTSKASLVATLCFAMFFSPCLEIEAYYLKAGFLGWPAVLSVSLVYLVITVLGMLLFVELGLRGATKIRAHYLEHHERQVTGLVLIALGALAFFVEF